MLSKATLGKKLLHAFFMPKSPAGNILASPKKKIFAISTVQGHIPL
jgi:hypothetical protein